MKRPIRQCLCVGLLILIGWSIPAGSTHGQSQDGPTLETIREELSGPVTILLENGNRPSGKIVASDGDEIRLEVKMGGGSAQMSFPAEKIREMSFPGREALDTLDQWMEDPARTEDALALFRDLYRQRGAYLAHLDDSDLNLFVEYVRFALEKDKPLRAVAMIEVLRPHIDDPATLKSLDNAVLMAFFKADMLEEAAKQAEVWIDSAPPAGSSALGWRILAEIHFRDEAYEDALWTALYPIAFANQILPEHLDLCYAFAIAAAKETRQDPIAERLTREMRERALAWPEASPLLQPYKPDPQPETTEAEPTNAETEPTNAEEILDPIQTPSPLDPMESLPTRIYGGLKDQT
jgi:ribosomal protein S18 acetylase RimI-like enzyme